MGKSLASNKRGGKSMVVRMPEIRGKDFICPFALNPYHDCSEICFKEVSENFQDEGKEIAQAKGMKKLQRKVVTPISLKSLKSFNSFARIFVSMQHAAYQGGRTKSKGRWLISDRSGVHSNCKYASNPYHKCAEDCFDNAPYRDQPGQDLNSRDGDNTFNIRGRTSLQSQCIYSSIPQHECGKACFEIGQDSNRHESENFIDISTSTDKSSPLPNHINASTPCQQKHSHKALRRERRVNPECIFASNPYHACAEYCFENAPDRERPGYAKKQRSLKKFVSNKETSVNRQCKFASNPYHECGRDCFQTKLDQNKAVGVSMKLKRENKGVLGERGVDPKCQFASNPYHLCAEYCIQNAPEREKHGHAMKLNNQLEITEVVSKCDDHCSHNELDRNIGEGGKKETNHMLRSDVNSMCKITSNPFDKCSEGRQDKNQPVESIAVITEEEKRNSLSEMKCHLIMEKSTVNWELVEASRPTYNNIESFIGIKKSSKDSEFVEASNPDTDYAEFSKGITMPDVQLLQSDASHLFLEWAKYCTQTPEYEIVVQAERRGFGTKNVQYYDSSILEKFNAEGSLQRSLSTSILFFLGFLFALFKWTHMIRSVVMPSERKKISGSVMHKKHVESK